MPSLKSLNTPIEAVWEKAVDDIYMKFNLMPGYDRPTLVNWMANALKDAYEQGLAGVPYEVPSLRPTPPPRTVVRRTKAPVTIVEEQPVTRVMRRRTQG